MRLPTILSAAILLIAIVTCRGCAVVAFTVAAFAPPQVKSAAFELPKDKVILVFVDDLANPIDYETLKHELTKGINSRLIKNAEIKKTVRYEDLFRLIASRPDFNKLSVNQVAQQLNADVIIYVSIDKFSLGENRKINLWHGKFGTTVRVVTSSGKQLWPTDLSDGLKMPDVVMPQNVDHSPTYGVTLCSEMAEIMADRIAKLFYKHTLPRKHLGEK